MQMSSSGHLDTRSMASSDYKENLLNIFLRDDLGEYSLVRLNGAELGTKQKELGLKSKRSTA